MYWRHGDDIRIHVCPSELVQQDHPDQVAQVKQVELTGQLLFAVQDVVAKVAGDVVGVVQPGQPNIGQGCALLRSLLLGLLSTGCYEKKTVSSTLQESSIVRCQPSLRWQQYQLEDKYMNCAAKAKLDVVMKLQLAFADCASKYFQTNRAS